MPNHLVHSTSPYLLQHAHNPVDWYPWGPEALEKARREDKPIFLSIGYAACHWCHVMAHESFEDPQTAALMNEHFVSIKVDREERPDLDSIYMSAVSALTGQGGWPMSVFLTPHLQPFYGGTYFPPRPLHGLPAFKDLLRALSEAWTGQREEIDRVSAEIVAQLSKQTSREQGTTAFDPASLASATALLLKEYDWEHGGWGTAPKFPQPMAIEYLLRRSLAGEASALEPTLHALRAMAQGGMYDVLGGGFSRYSTDDFWRLPHFEKMLYDNAQLARACLHAWQITADPSFRRIAEETLDFVLREMTSPEGGFYSSLDADSEGQEGKFYAWTLEEIRTILGTPNKTVFAAVLGGEDAAQSQGLLGTLGDRSALFELAYGLTAGGNWEGKIVLQRAVDDGSLAARFNLTVEQVVADLSACQAKLLEARNRRIRPATDDKLLTSWNGLMLAALAEAARVFENPRYLEAARRNAGFLLTALRPEGHLRRAWRAGQTSPEVFLEDYAALILGLLALYQTDFDNRWYSQACTLAEEMLHRFGDPLGGFFDTPAEAETVITRPKELQDNAVPSGNALAVEALFKLAAFSGQEDWRLRGERALALVAELAPRYPTSFARWLSAADFAFSKVKQVAIIGQPGEPPTDALIAMVRQGYRPNLVVAAAPLPLPEGSPALLSDRPRLASQPTAYVCEGFVCRLPVTTPEELARQLQLPA